MRALRRFGGRYTLEDNTEVTLFTDHPEFFPSYQPQRPLAPERGLRSVQVSFVATARNEINTVQALVDSLFAQTRLPDEIVIVDTGSTDGTLERLQAIALTSSIPFQVLTRQSTNIAQGRNHAIRAARHEVIVVSDFGVHFGADWLEALVAPFEADDQIQVSAGRYEAVDEHGQPARWLLGRTLEQINPQEHLPSGVSIAFKKSAWAAVGGYPEWLTLTGEDTYFALELKRTTTRWAFVPEAVVQWEAPGTVGQYLRKSFRWSTGDGEAGTTASAYRWAFRQVSLLGMGAISLGILIAIVVWVQTPAINITASLVLGLVVGALIYFLLRRGKRLKDDLLLLGVYVAELLGYGLGYQRRRQVDQRRQRAVRGVFFILAGVPLDDTGGGARWAQIALELIRRQYQVVFVHKFPKYESVDLNLEIHHPNLLNLQLSQFRWEAVQKQLSHALADKPVTALVELPLGEFVPIVEQVRKRNGVVIYDLLDDWETALGGQWFQPDVERKIAAQSQVLVASAPALVQRLNLLTDRSVSLFPNAVNSYLFNPHRQYARPADFPDAPWSFMYIGALWGEWFDWDLLKRAARQYPDAAAVVIGDYHGQAGADLPSNIFFLGLKSQRDLPAYLSHTQVTIVPWKISTITQATSPLKVYEYLAMGKPVVAPAIEPLRGLPGVFLCQTAAEFVAQIGEQRHNQGVRESAEDFIQANNWQARVDLLLKLASQVNHAN
jgi:glycosyltransferase involved in cell wall biosynthesis